MDNKYSRILVVDDNAINREVLSFILKDRYGNVTTAASGSECMTLLEEQTFDLLLLDLNMPSQSGFDVLDNIHTLPSQKPSVIVVSADNDPATVSRALRMGAADYVTTPFNRDELMARVFTHLALRSREQHLEQLVQSRTAELEESNQQLKATQHRLVLAEKMASLGQLSAGIAHEINNPIGFILSNIHTMSDYSEQIIGLLNKYEEAESAIGDANCRQHLEAARAALKLDYLKEDIPMLLNDALQGAKRVKQIVTDLKVFSHPEQSLWQELDLQDCLNSVLNIISGEIKYKANVTQHIDATVPKILCVTTQIYQVFTNLLVNAAQAMEGFGEINITIRPLTERPDTVEILIQDNGRGMSTDLQKKIYDPFFTTKEVGVGTGLGLYVTYGIVENHGGEISVESTLGQGTCFRLLLPVKPPAASQLEQSA